MRYRDQRGKVKNDVAAVHEPSHESRIPDVSTDEIDFLANRLRKIVQPPIAIERIVLSKGCYVCSSRDKSFRQMRTDEAVGSHHQHLCTIVARGHPYPSLSRWDRVPTNNRFAPRPVTIIQAARKIQPRSEASVRREK